MNFKKHVIKCFGNTEEGKANSEWVILFWQGKGTIEFGHKDGYVLQRLKWARVYGFTARHFIQIKVQNCQDRNSQRCVGKMIYLAWLEFRDLDLEAMAGN